MSVINMVKNIKDLFPEYVVFIKIGTFYECYNNDSYIMSYLFKYKFKELISKDITCGFPVNSLNRILSVLDRKCINYLALDRAHNYEEIEKMNFKKKNEYNELLTKLTIMQIRLIELIK